MSLRSVVSTLTSISSFTRQVRPDGKRAVTRYRALGGRRPPETPGRTSSSAEVFAQKLFRACRKHRRELVYPGWYRPVIWFARHFPGVVERANRRIWRLK